MTLGHHDPGRRRILLGAAAGTGAMLLGCSSSGQAAPPPAPDAVGAGRRLVELEARFGGRIGVYGLDTGSGATVGHRTDERFLLCSTAKVPVAALVLRRAVDDPTLLDRRIRYDRSRLLEHAPVTSRRVDTGMTVAELCDAALTVSDNTAVNLLLDLVGGPAAVTAYVRGLGDPVTRFDRPEPELNDTTPGDERDTTTPARIGRDLQALALGDALPAPARDRLVGWMVANTTGARQVRAGVPADWRVGDKTGSGSQGESNDIAVVWPPGRAPLVLAVYTAPVDPENDRGPATIAEAARIVVDTLVPRR